MVAMEKNFPSRLCCLDTLCGRAYEFFDTDINHLGCLTKLKQSITVEDFIVAFERLAFHAKGVSDAFFRECFISGLKDEIQA